MLWLQCLEQQWMNGLGGESTNKSGKKAWAFFGNHLQCTR